MCDLLHVFFGIYFFFLLSQSNHWIGTIILSTCELIERPSKKDGFCFKLYHPMDQSIWAARGPEGETIGAVVQPLPTSHLIFRYRHAYTEAMNVDVASNYTFFSLENQSPEQRRGQVLDGRPRACPPLLLSSPPDDGYEYWLRWRKRLCQCPGGCRTRRPPSSLPAHRAGSQLYGGRRWRSHLDE